ncbi:MAG: putative S-layer protein [Gemmatimonadetes bacterium]|nr:putative S-layer protein [Gemmatimonadota bacterium]
MDVPARLPLSFDVPLPIRRSLRLSLAAVLLIAGGGARQASAQQPVAPRDSVADSLKVARPARPDSSGFFPHDIRLVKAWIFGLWGRGRLPQDSTSGFVGPDSAALRLRRLASNDTSSDNASVRRRSLIDALRDSLRLPRPPVREVNTSSLVGTPGSSFGSPSAFGAGAWDVFGGVGYQHRSRYTKVQDGAVVGGFGLFDPESWAGLEVALTSFATARHTFGSVGSVSLKAHHRFSRFTEVALGTENAASWGRTDGGRSTYLVGSHVVTIRHGEGVRFNAMSMALGVGNGRFRFEKDVFTNRQRVNVFGNLGLRLVSGLALATDWTGQNLNSGFSISPLKGEAFVVNAGFADLLHHYAGDGARFVISIGYGHNTRIERRVFSKDDRHAITK